MNQFTDKNKEMVERLLAWKGSPVLSCYMPVETAGPDKRKNPIRFQARISEIKTLLKNEGWAPEKISAYIEPLENRFDSEFWEKAGHPGFACFYQGPEHDPMMIWLADRVPEVCTLQRQVHLKPLLEAWNRNTPYVVLCLTHDRLSLYRGDAFQLEQFHDPHIPETAGEVLGTENEIKSIQFHTGTGDSASGERAAVFHGQGGPDNVKENQMKRFFQRVSGSLQSRLEQEKCRVILCGLPEVLAAFRESAELPHLHVEAIEQHPDSLEPEEIRRRASSLVVGTESGSLDKSEADYHRHEPKLRVADSVDDVLSLAVTGRIQTLYAARDHEVWGRFHPGNLMIEHAAEPAFDHEDLVDTCVRNVFTTGGDVEFLDDEDLKERLGARHVAAILRPA